MGNSRSWMIFDFEIFPDCGNSRTAAVASRAENVILHFSKLFEFEFPGVENRKNSGEGHS
jgi:hypothetical protein